MAVYVRKQAVISDSVALRTYALRTHMWELKFKVWEMKILVVKTVHIGSTVHRCIDHNRPMSNLLRIIEQGSGNPRVALELNKLARPLCKLVRRVLSRFYVHNVVVAPPVRTFAPPSKASSVFAAAWSAKTVAQRQDNITC